jgi:putative ABC transport system permease protein
MTCNAEAKHNGLSMLTWVKIAARNLRKNSRRSLFTILAVGLGFAAVNVFGGFTAYIFNGLKLGYIYAQANGHLTVFKKGFLTMGKLDPASYLLSEAETHRIREVLEDLPQVSLVTTQLNFSGLLSNGDVSTIFVATGRVPSDIRAIRSQAPGIIGRIKLFNGKALEDDIVYGIGLSSGLAKSLGLGLGSDAIAMAPTTEGQINALDVEVFQLFESPAETLNDKLMLVPLTFAQSLSDTTSVDRVTVLLHDIEQTESVKAFLVNALAKRGLHVEVKSWQELAPFYTKVKDMFNIIFLFVFVIVFVIVVMSVVNTISMAVMERTIEIGTLRALGLKRRAIIKLFAIESALLGLFGSALGVCLTGISWLVVSMARPTWIPPPITRRVPLEVYIVPEFMVLSMTLLVFLSLIAAVVPARKAARMNIVDALGHV